MPKHKISITLPQPCHQDWEQMLPNNKGRHCAMCQKTVIDFSLMNDGEIIDAFTKKKNSSLCGRFLNTQLDRPLIDTRYKPTFTSILAKRIAATVILLQSVTVAGLAQQAKGKASATYHHSNKKKAGHSTIRGKVVDVATGAPMAGIRVKISAEGLETLTDRAGRFSLALTADTASKALTIVGFPNYDVVREMDSFFIMEHQVTPEEIAAGNEIVLYRYPVETLPEHKFVSYMPPLVNKYRSMGGPMSAEIIRPATTVTYADWRGHLYGFWYRITKPFRKKAHRSDEE